ncbi:hypothetical protein CHS0354_023323 [Potamilus streckersoni]|uniref:Uncharacterized protein n=1 Tax=Potamilus streckersoni TaxID=2493646 RepID=A0AAE0T4K5_9BIVA|nr:hypothetical protein CHS0354_023323 [Potamilus streckersoni]
MAKAPHRFPAVDEAMQKAGRSFQLLAINNPELEFYDLEPGVREARRMTKQRERCIPQSSERTSWNWKKEGEGDPS